MNEQTEHDLQSNANAEARTVGAGRGLNWLAAGFDYFRRAPLPWVLMTVIFGVIYMIAVWIPLIGFIAASVAVPIFMGGLLLACQRQDQGETPEVADLFSGFKHRTAPLAIVGVLYLVGGFIIMLISGAIIAMMAGGGMMAGAASGHEGGMHIGTAMGAGVGALFSTLIAMVLAIPLMMAIWFAPALVLFKNLEPVDAIKRSFSGCLKNIIPFVIYIVLVFILFAIAAIPFGLGMLVALPMLVGSTYAGYQEIFA